jgi:hypothetical protein
VPRSAVMKMLESISDPKARSGPLPWQALYWRMWQNATVRQLCSDAAFAEAVKVVAETPKTKRGRPNDRDHADAMVRIHRHLADVGRVLPEHTWRSRRGGRAQGLQRTSPWRARGP